MKHVIVFLIMMTLVASLLGQGFPDPFKEPETSQIAGGLGVTWLDGQPYTTITVAPDVSFGKFGLGLYLQFLMDNNNNFKLRKDEYQGGAGILRAIRYVRYGHKYDPFYVRVGMLETATLANGFLMWNYNNGSNYDKRKIGLALDADLGKFGFETVASNLNHLELTGANLFVRPFRFFVPNALLLKDIRFYATFVSDRHARVMADSTHALRAFGFGADLHWLDYPVAKSYIYVDWGKFLDYGTGKAVGITFLVPNFIGVFGLAAKFEKRFIDDHFIPSLFGPLYELNRELSPFQMLENATKSEGYFGQLVGHVLHKVRLIGNYQRLNGVKHSGIMHLEALAPDLIPSFELRAYYDKLNIESFKDVRTLDINSVATVEVAYRLNRFMVLSTIYRWYWIEVAPGEFKPIERIEPRLSFRYQF